MGRELKRVAMDFDWPLKEIWKGYINPHDATKTCTHCNGGGFSEYARYLENIWYLSDRRLGLQYNLCQSDVNALVERNRLSVGHTADEVNRKAREDCLFHCGVNMHIVIRHRCELLEESTECLFCKGQGFRWISDELKELHEAWEPYEPPEGQGYQLWETTSEGSPMSPVFDTPEALANWLFVNKASSFGSQTASYDAWLKFIKGPGWAPSMVSLNGHAQSGVEFIASRPND